MILGRDVVDAVVDDQLRIELLNELVSVRVVGPQDRPAESAAAGGSSTSARRIAPFSRLIAANEWAGSTSGETTSTPSSRRGPRRPVTSLRTIRRASRAVAVGRRRPSDSVNNTELSRASLAIRCCWFVHRPVPQSAVPMQTMLRPDSRSYTGSPVRMLVISNFYPPAHVGGYEQECAGIVNHLRQEHSVLVLTSRRERRRVPRNAHVLRVLPYGTFRKRDSLRAPLWALGAGRTMRRLLRSFDPDLIFVWNSTQIPQAALRVAELSGRPIAYRVCEHWFGRRYRDDTFLRHLYPGERGLRAVWARAMRTVNRLPPLRLDVTTPTRGAVSWVSDALREMTPRSETSIPALERTIYWGIDQPSETRRNPPDEPTIAYVGRVTPAKGADIAVHALAKLEREHGVRARLLLLGPPDDPRYVRRLRALAGRLGVRQRVELRGALPQDEVWRELEGVHAVVIPSRWQEPAGLVTVESAARGVPVVAARSGGMPELLRDGEHALFFDIDDVEGCTQALLDVLQNPDAAAARAELARERAAEFRHDRYHAATDAFLQDALQAYGVSPSATARATASGE